MKISDFLLYAAQQFDAGEEIDLSRRVEGWDEYAVLTLPCPDDTADMDELIVTQPLRYALAAAMAKADGK